MAVSADNDLLARVRDRWRLGNGIHKHTREFVKVITIQDVCVRENICLGNAY